MNQTLSIRLGVEIHRAYLSYLSALDILQFDGIINDYMIYNISFVPRRSTQTDCVSLLGWKITTSVFLCNFKLLFRSLISLFNMKMLYQNLFDKAPCFQ